APAAAAAQRQRFGDADRAVDRAVQARRPAGRAAPPERARPFHVLGEQSAGLVDHARMAGAIFSGAPGGRAGRGLRVTELSVDPVRVGHEDLQRFIAQAFQAKGMNAADSAVVAEVLVWANLRGGDGHGVARLPRYLEMVDFGDMDPRGRPHRVLETDAFFILD